MAFSRMRRAKRPIKWVFGQFDLGFQATAAGVNRTLTLVGSGDIAASGLAGETAYVRRVVGTILVLPQATLAADGEFKWAIVRSFWNPAVAAAAFIDLDNSADYEDQAQLTRRDWMHPNTATRAECAQAQGMSGMLVDWRGNYKLQEGKNVLTLSIEGSVAYNSYVRLRCLLQGTR